MIHVSAPAIAALKSCSPQAVRKLLDRGVFGSPVRRGQNRYVALAAVERHTGVHFSPDQIERAAARGFRRMIRVDITED